eukprot:scaffold2.g7235.t1
MAHQDVADESSDSGYDSEEERLQARAQRQARSGQVRADMARQSTLLHAYRQRQEERWRVEEAAARAKMQQQQEQQEQHGDQRAERGSAASWVPAQGHAVHGLERSARWLRSVQEHERQWAALEAATAPAASSSDSSSAGSGGPGQPARLGYDDVPWPPCSADAYLWSLAELEQQRAQHAKQPQPQQQQQQQQQRRGAGGGGDQRHARAERRAYARACLRYHPDKFVARWGQLLEEGERARVLARVQEVAQALNDAWAQQARDKAAGGGECGSASPSLGDGTPSPTCWEQDYSGQPAQLQLDDHEVLLLTAWLRCGAWLHPQCWKLLEVDLLETGAEARFTEAREEHEPQAWQALRELEEAAQQRGHARAQGAPPAAPLRLLVRLKGGKAAVEARFCPTSGALLALARRGTAFPETWALREHRDWGAAAGGLRFPALSLQATASGMQEYVAEAVEATPACAAAAAAMARSAAALRYARPPSFAAPRFAAGARADTPAFHTASGHLLVEPRVNGVRCAMLLDSGASGFVVSPAFAAQLGDEALPAFGSLSVGSTASRFRRAATFQLGPLLIESPLLMEMRCDHLPGVPRPLAGIVGYEVFQRCVIVVPPRPPPPPVGAHSLSPAAALAHGVLAARQPPRPRDKVPCTIRILDPAHVPADATPASLAAPPAGRAPAAAARRGAGAPLAAPAGAAQEGAWLPLTMLSSLPHVEATVWPSPGGHGRRVLLMLDTGAGGTDVLLNAAGAEALGLLGEPAAAAGAGSAARPPPAVVSGLGGTAMHVETRLLHRVQLGAAVFTNVGCHVVGESMGGMDLSAYTHGIAAGGLLGRCTLVFDYPRGRLGVIPQH